MRSCEVANDEPRPGQGGFPGRSPIGCGSVAPSSSIARRLALVSVLAATWHPCGAALPAQMEREREHRRQAVDGEWGAARSSQTRPAGSQTRPLRRQSAAAADSDAETAHDFDALVPAHFATAGQVWREYNIAPYTARVPSLAHPEQLLLDWILKSTGNESWHGNEVAVLASTRGKLRVFHRPEVHERVAEIVDRFVRPVQFQAAMRFQFVSTSDLDWRNGLAHQMKPVATGPQGQQVWLVPREDVALVRERLRLDRYSRLLGDHQLLTSNGQAATAETSRPVNYISGIELSTGAYLAYRPVIGRLHEGATLSVNPLWAADGSGVDIELKLETQVVTRLHSAQNTAPLSTGNQEMLVQVPEVAAGVMEANLFWPSSKVLVVSVGVQQGMLGARRGTFSFAPPPAELLIIGEIDSSIRDPDAPHDSTTAAPGRPGVRR